MLSLALRLLAITSGLFGIIFCAQTSASIFTNPKSNAKSPNQLVDMDDTIMIHQHPYSPSKIRPILRVDTSFTCPGATQDPIVEVFPLPAPSRRPSAVAAALLDSISKQVTHFMADIVGTLDEISSKSSRRATRMQRRFTAPRNRWAAAQVECVV